MTHLDRKFAALEHFREWSNYLLIATVASIGWIGSGSRPLATLHAVSLACLTCSLVMGILAISTLPHLTRDVRDDDESIYQTKTIVWIFPWQTGERRFVRLKWLCWPQHALFLAGVLLYSLALLLAQ